jgi:hypothetical protein
MLRSSPASLHTVQHPLGEQVDWTPARLPARAPLRGSYVLARPFLPGADAQPLYAASHPPDGDLATWTYLPDGPYESAEHLRGTIEWALSTPWPTIRSGFEAWLARENFDAHARQTHSLGELIQRSRHAR